MNCPDIRGLLTDALIEDLSPVQKQELEQHLAECEACRAYESEVAGLWTDLGRLEAPLPGNNLADKFAASLKNDRRKPLTATRIAAVAAAIILFLGGVATGRATGSSGADAINPAPGGPPGGQFAAIPGRRFMLMVRENGPGSVGMDEAAMSEEYGSWARSLPSLIEAAPFGDEEGWLNSSDPNPNSPLQGFFMITAENLEEAVEIARSSPHFRYGGVLEVRALGNR